MRQIHIFFRFSKVIRQFVWLFPCFVRVVNPCCGNLKLFKNFGADGSGVSLKQFQVPTTWVHNSYKTRKLTLYCIGNFEENMDLSHIYLAVKMFLRPVWVLKTSLRLGEFSLRKTKITLWISTSDEFEQSWLKP